MLFPFWINNTDNGQFDSQHRYIAIFILFCIVLFKCSVQLYWRHRSSKRIISVIRSYNKTKVLNEIEQNGNYLLAKIAYDLKSAKSLVSFDPGGKIITITDSAGIEVVYKIEKVDIFGALGCISSCTGTVTRKYGAGDVEPMT